MFKIALLVESNPVWLLKPIEETIKILQKEGYEIIGIIETEAILSKKRGKKIALWYLKTFGFYDFIRLGIFSSLRFFKQFLIKKKCISSFDKLSKEFQIQYIKCETPNKLNIANWIKVNQIDIVISQTSFILKNEILMAPKLGVINKHAALLPSNKGLFPYFWAFKNNSPQGISYHLMNDKIDEGPILIQEYCPKSLDSASMVNFYRYVYRRFPNSIKLAVEACINKNYKKPINNMNSTYFSLPTREDVKLFRKKGGSIIDWQDIFKDFLSIY